MILEDTPYEEIYDSMRAENEKVFYQRKKHLDACGKKYVRTGIAKNFDIYQYTIPSSHNTYVVWCHQVKGCPGQLMTNAALVMNELGKMIFRDSKSKDEIIRKISDGSLAFPSRSPLYPTENPLK